MFACFPARTTRLAAVAVLTRNQQEQHAHTHTPATAAAFSQFSSYHFSTLLTLQHCLNHNNNKSKPNNNSKNNNIFKL